MKKISKRQIAPDYHRIPHFNKEISNMTHDDIQLELDIQSKLGEKTLLEELNNDKTLIAEI